LVIERDISREDARACTIATLSGGGRAMIVR
jgi:hypothetical protein